MEFLDPVMLCGFTLAARLGEELVIRETLPLKSFTAAMTMSSVEYRWVCLDRDIEAVERRGILNVHRDG
jgi:hypothetical protein